MVFKYGVKNIKASDYGVCMIHILIMILYKYVKKCKKYKCIVQILIKNKDSIWICKMFKNIHIMYGAYIDNDCKWIFKICKKYKQFTVNIYWLWFFVNI